MKHPKSSSNIRANSRRFETTIRIRYEAPIPMHDRIHQERPGPVSLGRLPGPAPCHSDLCRHQVDPVTGRAAGRITPDAPEYPASLTGAQPGQQPAQQSGQHFSTGDLSLVMLPSIILGAGVGYLTRLSGAPMVAALLAAGSVTIALTKFVLFIRDYLNRRR